MSANRFFHEIRFNKAVSYDANIVLYYDKGVPEIRITVTNSDVELSNYLYDYFINKNKMFIINHENKFNDSKEKIIGRLKDKREFASIVNHYWKALTERDQINQSILMEKEELAHLSFDQFLKILNRLTQASDESKN